MDYEAVIRQAMEKLGYGIGDVSAPQGVGITADEAPEQAGEYTFSGAVSDVILGQADKAIEGIGDDLNITSPDRWSGSEGGWVGGGLGGRFEAFTIYAETAEQYRGSAKYTPHGGTETDAPDDAAYLIGELLNNERSSIPRIVSDESGFSSGTATIALRWDAEGQPDGSVIVYLTPSVDRGDIGLW